MIFLYDVQHRMIQLIITKIEINVVVCFLFIAVEVEYYLNSYRYYRLVQLKVFILLRSIQIYNTTA